MSLSRPLTPEQLESMAFTPDLLGQMIKTRRHALGWSQSECAKKIGVNQQTIARWEDGAGEATAYKIFNFVMKGETKDEVSAHWIRRALKAEAVVDRIANGIVQYRKELRNGNETR